MTSSIELPEPLQPVEATVEDRAEHLDESMLSRGLDWTQIMNVASFWRLCRVGPESVVIPEGSTAPLMGVVIAGEMRAEKLDSKGAHQELARFGRGRIFGEMAMMDGEPASASVVSSGEAKLMMLTGEAFAELCNECPGPALVMVKTIARQISQKLRATSGKLVDLM